MLSAKTTSTHDAPDGAWRCRELEHLSIQLVGRTSMDYDDDLRFVMMYLVVNCPNLVHLELEREDVSLRPEGGLCLTSRLPHLQRLVFRVFYYIGGTDGLREEHARWILMHPPEHDPQSSQNMCRSVVELSPSIKLDNLLAEEGCCWTQMRLFRIELSRSRYNGLDIARNDIQVQELISHALTDRELFVLPLVSSHWNNVFTRYLWRDLFWRRGISPQGLARHGHHARRLSIGHHSELKLVQPFCHRLRDLQVNIPFLPLSLRHSPKSFLDSLPSFLLSNRITLTTLSLGFSDIDQLPLLQLSMPYLKELWLFSDRLTCPHVAMFLDHSPSLRKLQIVTEVPIVIVPEAFQQAEYSLEEIINDRSCLEDWDLTLFLWQRCPKINSFMIPFVADEEELERFEQALRMHPGRNRTLDILVDGEWEEEIASLVEACPADSVSKLFFDEALTATDVLWNVLLQHQMGSLTFLDLSSSMMLLPKGSIQTLLCSCRTLKYFDAIPESLFPGEPVEQGMLAASDVAKGLWACLDVELLRIVVSGICEYAEHECEHPGRVCEEKKQGILRQFQQLTKLKTLGICHGKSDSSLSWPMGHVDGSRSLTLLEIWSPDSRTVEIVDLISRFLDRTSVVQCTQVSKSWHTAWLPSLWSRIEADHWRHEAFLASLPAHGDLIRILKCSRYDELELLGPNATHLSLLEMPKTMLVNMDDHVRILQQNRDSLQSLSVLFSDIDDVSTQFWPMLSAIRRLRNLKTLKFDGSLSLDEAALEYVLGGERPPLLGTEQQNQFGDEEEKRVSPIQELSLSGISFFRHPFNHGENFANKEYIASQHQQLHEECEEKDGHEEVRETRRPFLNITSLLLDDVNCDPELILNLTSRFPVLQRLSLTGASEFQPDAAFPVVLARHCPNLRWLDISNQETLSDDFIASMIRLFPNLTTLKASDTLFSEESMLALVGHCQNLVSLDISGCYNISSTTFQRFLCQCSKLRHLEAWDNTLNVVELVASFFWMGGDRQRQRMHQHQQLHHIATSSSSSSSSLSSSPVVSSIWAASKSADGGYELLLSKATAAAAVAAATEAAKATVRTGFSQQGGWWACSRTLESLTLDLVYQPWSRRKVRQFLETLRQRGFGSSVSSSSSFGVARANLEKRTGDQGEQQQQSDDWMMTTSLTEVGRLLTDKKHLRNVAYQQLGKLVNIRTMCVGAYELDPEDEDDEGDGDSSAIGSSLSELSLMDQEEERWIDFSLVSGLDHLRSLKKLSEISLIRIGQPPEHRVEQAELEWMLRHWPNLRKIEGLDQRNEDEEEGIDEDEPVNELVAWLYKKRPDILVDDEFI
ncbi:hypothetical protein BGZ73_005030 [Actinomortierella ambigua]|nr:hypothetical protein BGZ73_005030 [Actinomortierella ambigua]